MIPFSSTSTTRSDSQSRTDSTSAIRPRNRRLISTAGGNEQELGSTSGTSTPGGSRGVSPIPRSHFSSPAGNGSLKGSGRLRGTERDVVGRESSRAVSANAVGGSGTTWGGGWLGGWSAIQGLASSVLGNGDGSVNGKSWGPEQLPRRHDGGIGQGINTDREDRVRRKKMARVLEGRDDPGVLDQSGNLKRRTSLEDQESRHNDEEGDALVYIHHVKPSDTLAGVVLRYNCQPAVFRKANRFWPNDSIQIRKTVVLPVDACTIKGRPCDPPSPDGTGVDLLAPTPGTEEPPSLSSGTAEWPSSSRSQPSAARANGKQKVEHIETEEGWTHVRWVLLDSSPTTRPTQIARMPRKTLGYFPPRRRKSRTTLSTVSTPRVSTDLSFSQSPGGGSTPLSGTPTRRTSNLSHRPNLSVTSVPGSYFPPPGMTATNHNSLPTRGRRDSAATRTAWMTGPGGVGTLGPKVRTPGPAKDSMNVWMTKHLPGIAIDNLPSAYAQTSETARLGFSSDQEVAAGNFNQAAMAGNSAGMNSPMLGQNGLGIENAAAAVEGWIRRIAVKGVPGTPLGGAKARDEADLIELLDGTGSDDGHGGVGFELNPGAGRMAVAGGREDLDGMVRGRGRAGTKSKIKGGKSD